jgi:Lrp/AsnC family transcriptional regulator, leucine-responsive regulatory protein
LPQRRLRVSRVSSAGNLLAPMYVDSADAKILALLQREGRATLDDLSRVTGLSSSQCQRRLKRLEKVGLIQRYAAIVSPEAVGYPLQVFTLMSVDRDDADTFDRFEDAIRLEPTVIYANVVTGTADFLLWAVARDLVGYRELLRRLTDAFPTIKSVTTLVMLDEVKAGFVVPIESLGEPEPASHDR